MSGRQIPRHLIALARGDRETEAWLREVQEAVDISVVSGATQTQLTSVLSVVDGLTAKVEDSLRQFQQFFIELEGVKAEVESLRRITAMVNGDSLENRLEEISRTASLTGIERLEQQIEDLNRSI